MHVFETGLCVSEVANGFFSDIDDGRDFAVVCAPGFILSKTKAVTTESLPAFSNFCKNR